MHTFKILDYAEISLPTYLIMLIMIVFFFFLLSGWQR